MTLRLEPFYHLLASHEETRPDGSPVRVIDRMELLEVNLVISAEPPRDAEEPLP